MVDDYPELKRETPALRAAIYFNTMAARHLAARPDGVKVTQKRIATIIGESPPAYSDALKGRGGSLDRIAKWIHTFNAKEGGSLAMIATGDAGYVDVVIEEAGQLMTVVDVLAHPRVAALRLQLTEAEERGTNARIARLSKADQNTLFAVLDALERKAG